MVLATNLYTVLEAAAILGGLCLLAATIGTVIILGIHVDDGHAIFPWSHRKRVERMKADMEIAELRVKIENADLKHLALQPVRQKLLEAVESGDTNAVVDILKNPQSKELAQLIDGDGLDPYGYRHRYSNE